MSKLVVTITLVCVLRDVVVVASPRDIRNHFHLRASSHRRLATHEKDLKKKDLIAKRSDTKYRTVNVRTDDDRVHSVRRSPPAVIEP